jgi:co-chaperonin GroES (HSP10)
MLHPTHGRILFESIKPPTTTPGGLAIPEAVQAAMQQPKGTILLVSDDLLKKDYAKGMVVGAVVHFLPYAGATVVVEGQDRKPRLFLVLKPSDIVAIEDVATEQKGTTNA